MSEATFTLGKRSSEYLSITPLYRPHEQCHDYWDGNWIESQIDIRVGGFSGRFQATLRANEFDSLREQLVTLYENLEWKASFSSLEEWLTIEITDDGRGHFEARCEARDQPGIGNLLRFCLTFDQSEIATMTAGLRAIVHAFPVRG